MLPCVCSSVDQLIRISHRSRRTTTGLGLSNDPSTLKPSSVGAMAGIPPEELEKFSKANRGPEVIAIVSAFTSLASIAVGLRLFARLKITKMFGQEDVFIILAIVRYLTLYVDQSDIFI